MKRIFLILLCIVFIFSVFAACNTAEESKTDTSENDSVFDTVSQTTAESSSDSSEEVSIPKEIETSEESKTGEESITNGESNAPTENKPVENEPEESDDDKNGVLDNTSTAPSDLEVTDIVLPPDLYNDAIDLFYSDDEYDYFFPAMTKYAMKVYYSDGSVQSVKDAIDAGNITLADLDMFDILYLRYSKSTGEYEPVNGE